MFAFDRSGHLLAKSGIRFTSDGNGSQKRGQAYVGIATSVVPSYTVLVMQSDQRA